MKLRPVVSEISIETIKGTPNFRVGDVFTAKVLKVQDRMLFFLLDNGTIVQTKLQTDFYTNRGQNITLQVKEITKEKIELSIMFDEGGSVGGGDYDKVVPYIYDNLKDTVIVDRLIANGVPVTPENIERVEKTIKYISYISDNDPLTPWPFLPEESRPFDLTLTELIGYSLNEKGRGFSERNVSGEMFSLLVDELAEINIEDIIKLIKHGSKVNLSNLILIKNLRENKGFPDILLKLLYREADTVEKYYKDKTIKNEKSGIPEIELIDIKLLLETASKEKKDPLPKKAAAILLTQRAILLERALTEYNLCILPFLFKKGFYGCMVKEQRGKGHEGIHENEALELEIETTPFNLGNIKVHINIKQKHVECAFLVEEDEAKSLIETERVLLEEGLRRRGFKTNWIKCHKRITRGLGYKERFIDLRV